MGMAAIETDYEAVLLDIEGTTTSIRFVYETLFPYARAQAKAFLECHWTDDLVQTDVAAIRLQARRDLDEGLEGAFDVPDGMGDDAREAALAHVLWQMDSDRKTTGLKALQGRIWTEGYATGELLGHIFDDVPFALRSWQVSGVPVHIYSSGSVAAQRLLFGSSMAGDLTPLLAGYFDTTTGPKKESPSYAAIAAAIDVEACRLLFVTDSLDEAHAAHGAGVRAVLSLRPGNAPVPDHPYPVVSRLTELLESP